MVAGTACGDEVDGNEENRGVRVLVTMRPVEIEKDACNGMVKTERVKLFIVTELRDLMLLVLELKWKERETANGDLKGL